MFLTFCFFSLQLVNFYTDFTKIFNFVSSKQSLTKICLLFFTCIENSFYMLNFITCLRYILFFQVLLLLVVCFKWFLLGFTYLSFCFVSMLLTSYICLTLLMFSKLLANIFFNNNSFINYELSNNFMLITLYLSKNKKL